MNQKDRYRGLYNEIDSLPIFFTPWYLDACCGGHWDVVLSFDKGDRLTGVLPYYMSKKYGISHITMPLLAPYLGPWIIYPKLSQKNTTKVSFEKKVITQLISALPNTVLIKMHCHPDLSNVLPAHWSGYDLKVRYTYILAQCSEEALLASIDAKQRNIIKSKEHEFEIVHSEDIQAFYELNEASFKRQGRDMLYDYDHIARVFKASKDRDVAQIYFAQSKGEFHSGILTVRDKSTTYCLAIGNDPKFKNSGSLSVLMYGVILDSFQHTDRFNFEGGMIPNIEKFFRSFGGVLTPYYRIEKARNKLYKGLFDWMGKI